MYYSNNFVGELKLTLDLLHLIKWTDGGGTIRKLQLYQALSSVWDQVSDMLKVDPYTKQSIKERNRGDPDKCIQEIIEIWLRDEKTLSPNYSCTWNGLCSLLEDVNLSCVSEELGKALVADVSSFKGMLQYYD